jgi:hypothetical protein
MNRADNEATEELIKLYLAERLRLQTWLRVVFLMAQPSGGQFSHDFKVSH